MGKRQNVSVRGISIVLMGILVFTYFPVEGEYAFAEEMRKEPVDNPHQEERYIDEAKEEFERLQKKLTHDPGHDLDLHKDLVKQVLASEIVAAYYYQKGVIQNTIRSDKQIKEAYRLLLDNEEYRRILSPKQ